MKIKLFYFCTILITISLIVAQDDYYEEKLTYEVDPGFGQMYGADVVTNGSDLVITSTSGVHCYSHNNTDRAEN